MNSRIRVVIPAAIFGGLLALAALVWLNPPQAPQRPAFAGPQMVVDVLTVTHEDYQVRLQSYGTVQPRTQTTLIAQVGGQLMSVNPKIRDGGFFEKGDVLGSIDARDYEADVLIAEATLMDARQTLAEAEARTVQAREDWQRLGNQGDAPALVLRLPQLQAAKARVISAESALQKARLDLERTDIVAPFAGRILESYVDIGQVVASNSQLADIYATDVVEIRLPLRNRDLRFIDLPESYRYTESDEPHPGQVRIYSSLLGGDAWDAKLVRTEGAIDENARQLHVIAQIDDPYARALEGRSPLKIGEYVTAELTGKFLPEVLVIPNTAIYQGSYVYVVEDDILMRRDVVIAWQNDVEAIIADGLRHGDALVTTPLGQVTSGIRVSVAGGRPDRMTGNRLDADDDTGAAGGKK